MDQSEHLLAFSTMLHKETSNVIVAVKIQFSVSVPYMVPTHE